MQLEGVFADQASQQTQGKGSQNLDRDAFMQLLVTQMKNQDPMKPQGSEELASQLAQFSSLEQMENMNDNLQTMALLQQSNALLSQLSESSSLIGKQVAWSNNELGTSGSGTVESVRLSEGTTFVNIDGQDVPLYTITEILGDPSTAGGAGDDAVTDDGAAEETATDGESDANGAGDEQN